MAQAAPRTRRYLSQRDRLLLGWHDQLCSALARVNPSLAFRYCSAIGRTVGHLRLYGATPRQVGAVFGPLPYRRRLAIAQNICAAAWMNRVVGPLVQRFGYDDFDRYVVSHCDQQILQLHADRQPAILAFAHAGPLLAISSTLHRLKIPALVITRTRHHRKSTSLDVCHVAGAASRRAALKRAVDKLRGGGIVLWSFDLPDASSIVVPFFGREFAFARGPFAAVRLTGALLIPVAAYWTCQLRMEVRSGESLCPRGQSSRPSALSRHEALATDRALAADASRWLEDHYRRHPEQISVRLLRRLHAG